MNATAILFVAAACAICHFNGSDDDTLQCEDCTFEGVQFSHTPPEGVIQTADLKPLCDDNNPFSEHDDDDASWYSGWFSPPGKAVTHTVGESCGKEAVVGTDESRGGSTDSAVVVTPPAEVEQEEESGRGERKEEETSTTAAAENGEEEDAITPATPAEFPDEEEGDEPVVTPQEEVAQEKEESGSGETSTTAAETASATENGEEGAEEDAITPAEVPDEQGGDGEPDNYGWANLRFIRIDNCHCRW